MLYTVISSQLFVEKRSRFFQVFPEWVQELWNKWELRLAVLVSLFLQILLIWYGDRRRHNKKIRVQFTLWLAYLGADWVAAVALGILSHSMEQPKANQMPAFWAPFLLLHLGGPDTITAFAVEDNELWLRHLLGLFIQSSIASYVSFRSWTGTLLSILSVLMYVPAMVKYGERTWVLSSASKEQLRKSMLGPPDPVPIYAKFMDEYISKQEEGFRVTITKINGSLQQPRQAVDGDHQSQSHDNDNNGGGHHNIGGGDGHEHDSGVVGGSDNDDDIANAAEILVKAHSFFETFKRLFAFLIISYDDWAKSKSHFQHLGYKKAFQLIEVELGFMFDMLYTKASVVYSNKGFILRSITSFFTICVFVVFLNVEKLIPPHPLTDVIITYLLFGLAIILEISAAIILIFSDSAFLLLRKHGLQDGRVAKFILRRLRKRVRWSNSIAQYNLLKVWLKDKKPTTISGSGAGACGGTKHLKLFLVTIINRFKKYWYTTHEKIPDFLKEFIFQQLLEKSDNATNFDLAKLLCTSRGSEVLQRRYNTDGLHALLVWSIDKVEFDQSILIWHIATDLCYESDLPDNDHGDSTTQQGEQTITDQKTIISKLLSDYMMYLLIVCPFMLPEGIGDIRSLETGEDAANFFMDKNPNATRNEACTFLLGAVPPVDEVKGLKTQSVLFDACRLANQLKSLEKRWEIISCVWVEMLSYAAVQCKATNHAQQLGQGGELLTHVWLLMAHLGLTEKFQMPTSFTRMLTNCK